MENQSFLTTQLITYIGNKRALLSFISKGVHQVQAELQKEKLSIFDVFSGSGVVSRFFKQYSSLLISNDLEKYAQIINTCYLANKTEVPLNQIEIYLKEIKSKLAFIDTQDSDQCNCDGRKLYVPGFIEEMYAPKDTLNILPHERCFYTPRNARYIDCARQLIDEMPVSLQPFLLAPLLAEASIHANTSGVFKGFYKNTISKTGQFGGNNKDALSRILGKIELKMPVFSDCECDVTIMKKEALDAAKNAVPVDLAYLDPPYNQHPYSSNYFMLNLIAENKRPKEVSPVSGIPVDWNRSVFNKKQKMYDAFSELIAAINAKYLLVSFNSDGFLKKDDMLAILGNIGRISILETPYNTFRGSRNLSKRSVHVTEFLYLVKKY